MQHETEYMEAFYKHSEMVKNIKTKGHSKTVQLKWLKGQINKKNLSKDILKTVLVLVLSSLIGLIFDQIGVNEINMLIIYVLGVLITAVTTSHRIYSMVSSVVSVCLFSFFFLEPKFSLKAYDQGYILTFIIMFLAAFLSGTLASKLNENARQSAQTAYRTQILFEANQQLQKARSRDDILSITASQLIRLLGKDIILYPVGSEGLEEPHVFPSGDQISDSMKQYKMEKEVVEWVFENNHSAGASTEKFPDVENLYWAIRVNNVVYGVAGIAMGDDRIGKFEKSILLSILGECALALENEQNAREKEEAASLAKNEQLRANLLRTISHDLRTPLTSISGNASNLLYNGDYFAPEVKKQLYSDIYDDALWLINIVENLLSVTRLEEGRLNLNISGHLIEEVITESLNHVHSKEGSHPIEIEYEDELLMAKIDARLIVQVVINILDNAMKYTPDGTKIDIKTWRKGNFAVICIADHGPGIPDEMKPHVFDRFYSGNNKVADSRRSLGLGLSLCKSIITAHGGNIEISDNKPSGAVFTFTLPVGEVEIHE